MEGGSAAGRRRLSPAWLETFANQDCLSFCLCTADHGCNDDPEDFFCPFFCSCEMEKFLCIDCQSEPLCRFTVLEHQKQRHQLLHVKRIPRTIAFGDPAIKAEEICELVNIDGIKRYEADGESFVYLTRDDPVDCSPNSKGVRCIECERILVMTTEDQAESNCGWLCPERVTEGEELESIKFCCIYCKRKGSPEAVEAAVVAAAKAAWEEAWEEAVPSTNVTRAEAAVVAAVEEAVDAAVDAAGPSSLDSVVAAANEALVAAVQSRGEPVAAVVKAVVKAALASRNAPRPLPGNDVLPDEGAHERDQRETREEERIPCKRKGSAAVEARAEAATPSTSRAAVKAAKKKAAVPSIATLPGSVVLPAESAHERDKREKERIPCKRKGSAAVEAAVPSRNALRALPGRVVLPDGGAHEEEERIPCRRKGSAVVEGRAEAAKKKAAVPSKNALRALPVVPDEGAHEEEEGIPCKRKGSAARAEAAKKKAAVPSTNALRASIVVADEGAHEEEQRIPCKRKGSAVVEARAEASKKKAAVNALRASVVVADEGAHERDKEEERIPPVEGQAEVAKPKKIRLFGTDICC